MLVLYGRLTFQPACVFRGLNKGLNCVCVIVLRMCTYIRSLFCVLKGHVSTPLGPLRRPL